MTLRRTLCLLACASVAVASPARADEHVKVRVDYSAPFGCPDESVFVAAVHARTSRFEKAEGGNVGPLLRVRVTFGAVDVSGDLVILDPSGASTHRVVTARTCPDVISALSLVAALSVDAAPASPTVASIPDPPAPTPPPPPPLVPSVDPVPPPAPRPPPREAPLVYLEPRDRPRFRFAVGVGADAFDFGSIGAAVGPSLVLEAAYVRPGLFSPALRLEVLGTFGDTVRAGTEAATFNWLLGRAQACPIRVRWVGRFTIFPCVAFAAGTLSTSVTGVKDPLSPTRGWFASDAEVRFEWSVTRALSLEVEGGAGAPFVRDRFKFAPNPQVYEPSVGFGVGSLRAVLKIP